MSKPKLINKILDNGDSVKILVSTDGKPLNLFSNKEKNIYKTWASLRKKDRVVDEMVYVEALTSAQIKEQIEIFNKNDEN